ncbi:MAG: Gfo/Idh/MocA family oxidoreductase, partial [Acidimicrobiales bacterium]
PHPMHYGNALLALEHDKPALVEKPFTMNAQEATALVAVARKRGLFLMEAMWTRFLPHVVAIRELLSQRALGEIVFLEADHGQWFDQRLDFRLFAPELGGGALLDLGVYPVSFASMVLGTPSRVTAMIEPAFTGVDGTTSMIFGYDRGAQALLTCTSLARSSTRASIVGTDARLDVEGDFYAPTSFSLTTRATHLSERFEITTRGRGLHYQATEVARCLRSGLTESTAMPLHETISIMETIDQVLRFMSSP